MGPNTLLPWVGVYGVSVLVILSVVLLTMRLWKSAIIPLVVLGGGLGLLHHSPVPQAG